MRIEKNKIKVNIVCQDGSLVKGTVHIAEGERLLDFLNDSRENFIAVTNVEFFGHQEAQSFQLAQTAQKKNFIALNKLLINSVEEA
jgi:ribonucleotide monophosphatase NagD (HAD superfamily)